jgi:hypothetical protein
MSDSPFLLPQPPRVTADEARDTARLWKGMADHLATLRDMAGARHAMQESQWWMAHAIALGQPTPPPEPSKD